MPAQRSAYKVPITNTLIDTKHVAWSIEFNTIQSGAIRDTNKSTITEYFITFIILQVVFQFV